MKTLKALRDKIARGRASVSNESPDTTVAGEQGTSAYLSFKRTIRVSHMVKRFDNEKAIYPRGLLTTVSFANDTEPTVRRVELFAKAERKTYGIIRRFQIAYSSERRLLQLAEASSSVICVRSVESTERSTTCEGKRRIFEDKLVLKRAEECLEKQEKGGSQDLFYFRPKTPELSVPKSWLDKMELKPGARVLVSNPVEDYENLPPNVS